MTLRDRLSQGVLIAPGAYDALTARIATRAGAEAVYMTGFGVAGSLLGVPDIGIVSATEMIDRVRALTAAAAPAFLIADGDNGHGGTANVERMVRAYEQAGAAAIQLEDQVFPKRCGHMSGKEVIEAEEMAGKIRACADVRDRLDPDFVINARTDSFAVHGLDEAIHRCNRNFESGADLGFIDGIKTRADVESAVFRLEGPLSVNLMDAISGMKTELIPIPELARLGVGRVSIPVASCMVAHKALQDFFTVLRESPTGILAGQTQWVSTFEAFTDFVGLNEYRELEDKYLPRKRLEEKYKGAGRIVD